jgi:hypothetical protein
VRSNSCDILGDVTTSLCQVISALATLVMSMEPTCQQSTLTQIPVYVGDYQPRNTCKNNFTPYSLKK